MTFPIGVSSKNVMYISITTSNYSSVYIIADKIMNAIWVVFKGTDSPKNMSIYSKPSSLISIDLCEDERDGTIGGIFKILSEIINTIMNSIGYLSNHFLTMFRAFLQHFCIIFVIFLTPFLDHF